MDINSRLTEIIQQHPDNFVDFLENNYQLTVKQPDGEDSVTLQDSSIDKTETSDDQTRIDGRVLIRYHRNKCDMTDPFVQQCRGIVWDIDKCQTVCRSFTTRHPYDSQLFNSTTSEVTEIIDGTMVNLYYYQGEWKLSTKGCLDANTAFWSSNFSFGELFQQVWSIDSQVLNPKYCYSFVLSHPDNRIVTNVDQANLYLIQVTDPTDDKCYRPYHGMSTTPDWLPNTGSFKFPQRHSPANITKLETSISDLTYEHPGYMIFCDNGVRMRLDNPKYQRVISLRGNTPNRFLNMLKLGKHSPDSNSVIDEYLGYYPEETEIWERLEILTRRCLGSLLYYYNRVMKQRKYTLIPIHLRHAIHTLHDIYRNKKATDTNPFRITHRVIKGYFHRLPTHQQNTILCRHEEWLHTQEMESVF